MSYEVGTHIDLAYLNRQPASEISATEKPHTIGQTAATLLEPGTQFSFKIVGNKFVCARRIPVAFA